MRAPQKGVEILSLLLFLAIVLYCCDYNFRRDTTHLDFRAFYAAGQMVAEGAGSRLYDIEAQAAGERKVGSQLRSWPPFCSATMPTCMT